jgi:hypothetical protein
VKADIGDTDIAGGGDIESNTGREIYFYRTINYRQRGISLQSGGYKKTQQQYYQAYEYKLFNHSSLPIIERK